MNGIPREAEVRVSEFRQREPLDGESNSQDTFAYLSYDDTNLYVVFMCKQPRRMLRARMVHREELFEEDQVSVFLDTFHDRRHAYVFSTNPLGVQQDGTITDGQPADYTFDTLWHSKGRLLQDGFVVWIAIPFKSVRFTSTPGQTWGVALGRSILQNNESSFWPYITQRENSFVAQMADLEGLKDISTGHNVQVIPYGTLTRSQQRDDQRNMLTSDERRRGMDAKVVFGDRVSLDATINPDFSEVESNEPQVTINQRYEVFFPEKRPFFIENANLFQTPLNLFFSRRIANPEYGARLTGKLGRWSIASLAANDRSANSDLLATERGAVNSAVRILRGMGEQTTIGVLALSRDFRRSSNRVVSVDARIKLGANWVLTGQTARSYDTNIEGAKRTGPSYFGELTYADRHFIYSHTYSDVSPDFRAPLGFVPRVNVRQSGQYLSYVWRPEGGTVVGFGPSWTGVINVDRRNRLQDWYSAADFKVFLRGQTQLTVQRSEAFERFATVDFRKHASSASFSTAWSKWMGISAFYQQGTTVNYSPGQSQAPFLSGSQIATFSMTTRPAPRIRSEQMYIFSRLASLPNSGSKTAIFNNHIVRWKTNFQVSRALSLRTIIDYNGLLPNASLFAPSKYRKLSGDVLLTYLLNPGTAVYVGYNARYEQTADVHTNIHTQSLLSTPVSRQLFAKMSYLFRF